MNDDEMMNKKVVSSNLVFSCEIKEELLKIEIWNLRLKEKTVKKNILA